MRRLAVLRFAACSPRACLSYSRPAYPSGIAAMLESRNQALAKTVGPNEIEATGVSVVASSLVQECHVDALRSWWCVGINEAVPLQRSGLTLARGEPRKTR